MRYEVPVTTPPLCVTPKGVPPEGWVEFHFYAFKLIHGPTNSSGWVYDRNPATKQKFPTRGHSETRWVFCYGDGVVDAFIRAKKTACRVREGTDDPWYYSNISLVDSGVMPERWCPQCPVQPK